MHIFQLNIKTTTYVAVRIFFYFKRLKIYFAIEPVGYMHYSSFFFFFLLYNIVLVLPYINMHLISNSTSVLKLPP